MVSVLSLVFDFTSMIVLSVSSAFIVYMLYRHFRGIKIPHFWIYFLVGFFLLSIHSFLANAFPEEPYLTFSMLLKLVANALIFLAIYSLYKRLAPAPL
ncbi:MAG: hypothetical protein HYT72_02350 [Candidatus Aenigmarchaeota archaeon]|nr:hypothetical protein [Candidatus Aenigmarchaeota archaeon]